MTAERPTLAVWKFASCDGCQLTILNCEDELLPLAGAVQIAYFPEATRGVVEGPYDVSLVEGSITTAARRRADPGDPADVRHAGDHRGLRDERRHPGAAQLRRRRRVPLDRLRAPRVPRHAGALDADRRPRAGRLRAARLPDRQAPAARGPHRVRARPAPAHPGAQRLRRVQAAGHASASPSRTARRASARSPRPAAARCAPRTPAAATAASGRRTPPTPPRSRRGWPSWACPSATCCGSSARSTRRAPSSVTRAAATPRPSER